MFKNKKTLIIFGIIAFFTIAIIIAFSANSSRNNDQNLGKVSASTSSSFVVDDTPVKSPQPKYPDVGEIARFKTGDLSGGRFVLKVSNEYNLQSPFKEAILKLDTKDERDPTSWGRVYIYNPESKEIVAQKQTIQDILEFKSDNKTYWLIQYGNYLSISEPDLVNEKKLILGNYRPLVITRENPTSNKFVVSVNYLIPGTGTLTNLKLLINPSIAINSNNSVIEQQL